MTPGERQALKQLVSDARKERVAKSSGKFAPRPGGSNKKMPAPMFLDKEGQREIERLRGLLERTAVLNARLILERDLWRRLAQGEVARCGTCGSELTGYRTPPRSKYGVKYCSDPCRTTARRATWRTYKAKVAA